MQQLRATLGELAEIATCRSCGADFVARENLGAHRCRYHPGTLEGHADTFTARAGNFSCCNTRSRGCARCDHVTLECETLLEEDLEFPGDKAYELLGAKNLRLPGVEYDATAHKYIVHRGAWQRREATEVLVESSVSTSAIF